MKRLLAHAREAGIAHQYRYVLPILNSSGWDIVCDFNDIAKEAFGGNVKLQNELSDIDMVLCGYDTADIDVTGALVVRAKAKRIPVVAILDAWKGIDRFWYSDNKLRPLADKIYVLDQILINWLARMGIPESRMELVRHPIVSSLPVFGEKSYYDFRNVTREKYGLYSGRPILLFLSEPIRSGSEYQSLANCVLREEPTLLHEWIRKKYGDTHSLLIRFHPREEIGNINGWMTANHFSLEESFVLSDLVVGVGSSAMIYAVDSGIPARNLHALINWTPNLSDYRPEIWYQLAEMGRIGEDTPSNPRQIKNNRAARNIVDLVEELYLSSREF